MLIKSVKIALKKSIGELILTPFELYACLFEVGNLVSQHPIGRIPNDPGDGAYLCPKDLLLGRATLIGAENVLLKMNENYVTLNTD